MAVFDTSLLEDAEFNGQETKIIEYNGNPVYAKMTVSCFESNTGVFDTFTGYFNKTYNFPTPPSKTGYDFSYWSLQDGTTIDTSSLIQETEDHYVYPHYVARSPLAPVVSYNTAGYTIIEISVTNTRYSEFGVDAYVQIGSDPTTSSYVSKTGFYPETIDIDVENLSIQTTYDIRVMLMRKDGLGSPSPVTAVSYSTMNIQSLSYDRTVATTLNSITIRVKNTSYPSGDVYISTDGVNYTYDGGIGTGTNATEDLYYSGLSHSTSYTLYWKLKIDGKFGPASSRPISTLNYYTLTWKDWDGSTIATASGAAGSAVTIPANPTRLGYTFAYWSDEPSTFTYSGNITAHYSRNTYYLTISSITGISSTTVTRSGTSLSNGAAIYYGDSLTISATASTGYSRSVTSPVSVTGSLSTSSYISVSYSPATPTITYSSKTDTSITFTVKNNNPYSVTCYYGTSSSPITNGFTLAANTTVTKTISGLSAETPYTVYTRVKVSTTYSSQASITQTTLAAPSITIIETYTIAADDYYFGSPIGFPMTVLDLWVYDGGWIKIWDHATSAMSSDIQWNYFDINDSLYDNVDNAGFVFYKGDDYLEHWNSIGALNWALKIDRWGEQSTTKVWSFIGITSEQYPSDDDGWTQTNGSASTGLAYLNTNYPASNYTIGDVFCLEDPYEQTNFYYEVTY